MDEIHTESGAVEQYSMVLRQPETGAAPVLCDEIYFQPDFVMVKAAEFSPGTKVHAYYHLVDITKLELLYIPVTKSFFVRRYSVSKQPDVSSTYPKGHTETVVMTYGKMAAGLLVKGFNALERRIALWSPAANDKIHPKIPNPHVVQRTSWVRPSKDGLW